MCSCLPLEKNCLAVGELPYTELGTTYVYGDSNQIVGLLNGLGDGSHLTFRGFAFGGDKYHNNVSPCIAAYVWKRTE